MKYFSLFFVIILSIFSVNGQIIQVFEDIKNTPVKLETNGPNIVDINSNLEIKLDRNLLIETASKSKGINTNMSEKLEKLNFLLINQIQILKKLESNIEKASLAKRVKQLGEYSVLMDEFYDSLTSGKYKDIRAQVDKYYDIYFDLLDNNAIDTIEYATEQVYVLKKLSEDADFILETMVDSEDFKKLTFQLVAFINTKTEYQRKVHIENFDAYADGEFYEVERWATSFSEKDKKAFEQTKQLAGQMNDLIDKDLGDFKDLLKANFRSIDCINDVLGRVQFMYNNKEDIFNADELEESESFLKNIKLEFTDIDNILSKIASISGSTGANDNVDSFNSNQQTFVEAAMEFPAKLDELIDKYSSNIEIPNEEIKSLLNQIKTCKDLLKEDIETVKSIAEFTKNMLAPFKKTANLAEEVADEAFSFGIEELPKTGYINLKTTGKRQNGDELEIKIKIRTEEEKANKQPGLTLEKRILELQQIKIYSITKVTLILAIPPSGSSIELLSKNRVQFSPSGSLLFKFGSRKSRTWNFISMGAGFNISTPDFDLNGSPDVALGAIVTVLKDIVSFGYSYNTTTNTPFWFVGLSIPVTLPGIPINNVQAERVK